MNKDPRFSPKNSASRWLKGAISGSLEDKELCSKIEEMIALYGAPPREDTPQNIKNEIEVHLGFCQDCKKKHMH
jgi:hypothetical protein